MIIDPKEIAQLTDSFVQEKIKKDKLRRKSFVKTYDMLCKITADYLNKRVGCC